MMTAMTETRDQLSRLVRDRRAELGLSLSRVAQAADAEGVTETFINRLERNQLGDTPKRDRLEALARGLQLPPIALLRAASEQYFGVGEVASEDGSAVAVVDNLAGLPPADRAAIVAMVEAFARERRRG